MDRGEYIRVGGGDEGKKTVGSLPGVVACTRGDMGRRGYSTIS